MKLYVNYYIAVSLIREKNSFPGFVLIGESAVKLFTMHELTSRDLMTQGNILECIGNMHKVMEDGFYMNTFQRATKRLPNGYWDWENNLETITEKKEFAEIDSGEGCYVQLYKDRCFVHGYRNDPVVEVDPLSFYKMMCDWEKAIRRWENERIKMMIEEKKKPYFKEYLMPMNLDYLEMMLKREIEITKEEAEKNKVSEEILRKKLKTEVLEKIVELEKNKNNMSHSKWIIEKEKLVDEYLGINEKMKNSNLETKSTKRTFLQRLFKR